MTISEEAWELEIPLDNETKELGNFSRACMNVRTLEINIANAKAEAINFTHVNNNLTATIDKCKEALINTHEYNAETIEKISGQLKLSLTQFLYKHKQELKQETRRIALDRIQRGFDVIAVDTAKKEIAKIKKIKFFKEEVTDTLKQKLTVEQYTRKIDTGIYDDGYAISCTALRSCKHVEYVFCYIDIDKQEGIDAFLNGRGTLEEFAAIHYIEYNGDDKNPRIHIPLLIEPDALDILTAKAADTILGIEVHIKGVMFAAGSPYYNGGLYRQKGKAGIDKLWILNKTSAFALKEHIASICQEHGVSYFAGDKDSEQEKAKFRAAYTAHLHDENTVIKEGERHDTIKFICCSYFGRFTGEWDNLTHDQRFERVLGYDKKYCKPPLNDTDPQEVLDLWNWTVKTFRRQRDQRGKLEKMKEERPKKDIKKNLMGCAKKSTNHSAAILEKSERN
jgi:hypothetical protein